MLNNAAFGAAAATKQLLITSWPAAALLRTRANTWSSLQSTAGYATGGGSGGEGPGEEDPQDATLRFHTS